MTRFLRRATSLLTYGRPAGPPGSTTNIFHITDRLNDARTVDVPGHRIAPTVSAWLAELDVESPLVEDLAEAAQKGDWSAVHAVGEHLSVEVTLCKVA